MMPSKRSRSLLLNLSSPTKKVAQLVTENTSDLVFLLKSDLTITYINPAFQKTTGWTSSELKNQSFTKLIPTENLAKTVESFQQVISEGSSKTFEMHIAAKSVVLIGECILSANRNQLIGIFRNLSSQKTLEKALEQSEIKNQALLNAITDLTFRINKSGVFLDFIAAKSDELTKHSTDFLGKNIREMLPEIAGEIMNHVTIAIDNIEIQTFEFQIFFKGSIQIYKARVFACGNDEALVIIRNITESKLIEQALFESEKKYRYLVEHANDGICITQNMLLKYANQQLARLLGYTVEEITNTSFTDYIPFDKTLKLIKMFKRHVSSQKSFYLYETILTHRDGNKITVELSGCLIFYEGHRASLILVRDITKRKQAEEALIAEKERLAVTLSSIGDAVITTDIDAKILLINQAVEELTGWTQREAIGKLLSKVFYIINDKTSEPCENPVEKVFREGNTIIFEKDTVLVSREGKERYITVSCAPIRNKKNLAGAVLVFRDINGKHKMEEEMLKNQKLESIGILAGGLAHDFNNILAGILANTQLVKLLNEKGKDISKYFNIIEEATLRASTLTQQLLTFSKGGTPIKKVASIANLIKDTVDFALRGSKVKCNFFIPEDLYSVEVDEGQMSQVINNLIINAVQAMPEGGLIILSAENTWLNEKSNDIPLKTGNYVKIMIKDHGGGIPEENLTRIFDPYFTTKPNGNGLGLTTSYSVIKKHGGYIQVESEVGIGTSFYIYLPASEGPKKSLPNKSIVNPVIGCEGKILLMDDEVMIQEVIGEMLNQMGYRVLFAQNGDEVLKIYQQAKDMGDPFDAVIMDLTIPGGMGGKETISKLLIIDPEVKAIVSSGYFNDPVMANYKEYGFCEVVAKPYKIEELSEALFRIIQKQKPVNLGGGGIEDGV